MKGAVVWGEQLSIWFPSLSRYRCALLSMWESEGKSPSERLRIIFFDKSTVSRGSVERSDLPMKDICGFHYATPQNEHGLHLYTAVKRQKGRMTGYGDGSNRNPLFYWHTERRTMPATWVAVLGSLIFLQLGPCPLADTDATESLLFLHFKWAFCPKFVWDPYRPFIFFF